MQNLQMTLQPSILGEDSVVSRNDAAEWATYHEAQGIGDLNGDYAESPEFIEDLNNLGILAEPEQ